jgi:tetratricopeptide (TPR) repeat protein
MISNSRLSTLAGAFLLVLAAATAFAQAPGTPQPKPSKSAAYYHAAMGHLYSELAAQYGGRGEYVGKAIDNYKLAMRYDPETASLAQELAELYLQSGQIRSAVNEFEEIVKRNPDDINGHRILGRLYAARIRGEGQQARINDGALKQAIAQHERVSEMAPRDLENWLMLGRLQKLAQNSIASEKAYKKALAMDPENEDALTGLAMVYSDLGDTTSASQVLKRVADKNPSLRTLTALAAAYEQLKDFKAAAETYGRAVELNKDPDLKRAYAQALFSSDDLDKARAVFEELAAEDPNDLLAVLRLSQIYRQKRDFGKAEEYAKRATKLDPNNLEIQYNEVSLLEAEGKSGDAIARLKEILGAMPKKPESISEKSNRMILLERLGILYRLSDQTANAVAAFREIVDLDPDAGGRAYAQIIDALRAGKDYAAAERESRIALQKYPNDRVVKTVVANVHSDLGHFKEAEASLKTLLDGKGDRETWISIAQIHEKAKNFPEMAKAIDEADKLSKSEEERENIYFLRGAMYERMKKFDLAEEQFRQALKLNPQSASALNYLGYMLADRNVRLPEALEMVQKAVSMEPTNGAFLDSLGWVYFRLNKLDDAAENLRQSIARSGRDATVHDHLGDVYNSQSKLKEAIAQWERAVQEMHASAPSDLDTAEITKIQKKLEHAKVRQAKEMGAANKKN